MIAMFDAIDVSQIPADAVAVAGYVGGHWPTFGELASRFPHALPLSIAIDSAEDAECLDIEPGDAAPPDAAGWYARQRARGVARPCLYASADTMESGIVPVVRAGRIVRSAVRLWSAHYTGVAHICGPRSCGAVSIDVDGTQWTSRAMGRSLDQSLLAADFFGSVPAPTPKPAPPAAKATVANAPRTLVTDGKQTLAELARENGTGPSTVLRMTAENSPGRVFEHTASVWLGGVFARDSEPVPAGLRLWLPGA